MDWLAMTLLGAFHGINPAMGWLFAVALAGPPEGLDLDDPVPWEEASRQLFEGPPGCWEIVGKATWNHDGARWGVSRGSAAFAGRLVDGVWANDLYIEPLGEIVREGPREVERRVYRDDAQPFLPLLGRHSGDTFGDGGDSDTANNTQTTTTRVVAVADLETVSATTSGAPAEMIIGTLR